MYTVYMALMATNCKTQLCEFVLTNLVLRVRWMHMRVIFTLYRCCKHVEIRRHRNRYCAQLPYYWKAKKLRLGVVVTYDKLSLLRLYGVITIFHMINKWLYHIKNFEKPLFLVIAMNNLPKLLSKQIWYIHGCKMYKVIYLGFPLLVVS